MHIYLVIYVRIKALETDRLACLNSLYSLFIFPNTLPSSWTQFLSKFPPVHRCSEYIRDSVKKEQPSSDGATEQQEYPQGSENRGDLLYVTHLGWVMFDITRKLPFHGASCNFSLLYVLKTGFTIFPSPDTKSRSC